MGSVVKDTLKRTAPRCSDELDDDEVGLHPKVTLIDRFTANSKPGIFRAGYASSAVVEAITYVFASCVASFHV